MSIGDQGTNNLRSAVLNDAYSLPTVGSDNVLRTPFIGNVRALGPPPLPQAPMQPSLFAGAVGAGGGYYGGGGMGSMYGNSYGYGGFGNSYGGYGGYGSSPYNRYVGSSYGTEGTNALDPEYRFIQLAEASSRPAFQSIESLVMAIGNIASMLDSTFFALTSSFRAILGVAANFGRLRGVFAQFWHTFALFRGINWLYKKILYWLRLSKLDPSKETMAKAFAEALNDKDAPPLPRKGQSPWPVLAFLSFIFTAPYLIMKLLGTVANSAQEEARNPAKWVRPIETVALYDFQARHPSELSIATGQRVLVAPKEIQNTQQLLNTGWGLASVDGRTSGLIPLNYVKSPQQIRQEQQQQQQQSVPEISAEKTLGAAALQQVDPQPSFEHLKLSAFAPPPNTEREASAPQANKSNTSATVQE